MVHKGDFPFFFDAGKKDRTTKKNVTTDFFFYGFKSLCKPSTVTVDNENIMAVVAVVLIVIVAVANTSMLKSWQATFVVKIPAHQTLKEVRVIFNAFAILLLSLSLNAE